jgi:hypothetical protein
VTRCSGGAVFIIETLGIQTHYNGRYFSIIVVVLTHFFFSLRALCQIIASPNQSGQTCTISNITHWWGLLLAGHLFSADAHFVTLTSQVAPIAVLNIFLVAPRRVLAGVLSGQVRTRPAGRYNKKNAWAASALI